MKRQKTAAPHNLSSFSLSPPPLPSRTPRLLRFYTISPPHMFSLNESGNNVEGKSDVMHAVTSFSLLSLSHVVFVLDLFTFTILMSVFSWYMWSCRSSLSVSHTHTAFMEPVYHCCKEKKTRRLLTHFLFAFISPISLLTACSPGLLPWR